MCVSSIYLSTVICQPSIIYLPTYLLIMYVYLSSIKCQLSRKKIRRLWLEVNDKDLLKGLKVYILETKLGNTQSVPRKEEKLRVVTESYTLEKNQSCTLSFYIDLRW